MAFNLKMEDVSIIEVVANNVKIERIKKGYTQEKLAELSGLHRTYIGIVERAKKNLTVKNLGKIAQALEIEPTELLKRKNYVE